MITKGTIYQRTPNIAIPEVPHFTNRYIRCTLIFGKGIYLLISPLKMHVVDCENLL